MIRLATFNLFWFPSSHVAANERDDDDETLVARVVARLDADALVFQEILDPDALQHTLALVTDRYYRVVQSNAGAGPGPMRVVVAFDEATLELVESSPIVETDPARDFDGRRAPLALRLRDRVSDQQFWLVGVHLKSGLPSSDDPLNDQKRGWECERIAAWLRALPAEGAGHAPSFLLGDFNLEADRPVLASLTAPDGPATGISARVVNTLPEHGEVAAPDGERWSTLRDGVIIDHAFHAHGGSAWIQGEALVYAFDLDPAFAEPRTDGVPFFLVEHGSGYEVIPWQGETRREVRAMYRVSDHRPVRIDVSPPSFHGSR